MATRAYTAESVVSFFQGDDNALSEVFFDCSDDDLGMIETTDSEEENEGTVFIYNKQTMII